jgi:hypothetical protein
MIQKAMMPATNHGLSAGKSMSSQSMTIQQHVVNPVRLPVWLLPLRQQPLLL